MRCPFLYLYICGFDLTIFLRTDSVPHIDFCASSCYNVLDLEKQKKLVAFIQNYNKKIEKEVKIKQESIKVLDTKEEKDIKIQYMDNEPLEHVIDPLSIQAKNMLDSLNGLDKDMVFKMLENLSSNKNFITIINYITFIDLLYKNN